MFTTHIYVLCYLFNVQLSVWTTTAFHPQPTPFDIWFWLGKRGWKRLPAYGDGRCVCCSTYTGHMNSVSSCWIEYWLVNVTCNDISVLYVTAHKCAGELKKKLDLRSGSQLEHRLVIILTIQVWTALLLKLGIQNHIFCSYCSLLLYLCKT